MIQTFRDLQVWQKGIDLAVAVYKATEKLPKSEMFGLTSQARKSVVSIPANVAEGKAIGGQSYPHHLKIALGSEAELQTHIELARRLNMLGDDEASKLLDEVSVVGRMLTKLLNSLPRN
jgi:four helix bundle protein